MEIERVAKMIIRISFVDLGIMQEELAPSL